jgi:hypothetical protein
MIGVGKYVLDRQGPLEFDCVGLQDWALDQFGVRVELVGSTLPQTVYYFASHWTGQTLAAHETIIPGDILIIGNPSDPDYHGVYAHTGMATSAVRYVSALNPTDGLLETTIPTKATFKVIKILRAGWKMAGPKPVYTMPGTPIGIARIRIDQDIMGPKATTGPELVLLPLGADVVAYDIVSTAYGPAYPIFLNNVIVYLLIRNCVLTPISGNSTVLQAKIDAAIKDLS